jgi:hypothetical protein
MRKLLDSFQPELHIDEVDPERLARLTEEARENPDNPDACKRLIAELLAAARMQVGPSCGCGRAKTPVFRERLEEVLREAYVRFPRDPEFAFLRVLRLLSGEKREDGLILLEDLRGWEELESESAWEIPYHQAVLSLGEGNTSGTAEYLRQAVGLSFLSEDCFNSFLRTDPRPEMLLYDLETLSLAADVEAGRNPQLQAGSLITEADSVLMLRRFSGMALISSHDKDLKLSWGVAFSQQTENPVRPDCLADGPRGLLFADGAGERILALNRDGIDNHEAPLLEEIEEDVGEIQSFAVNGGGEIFFWGTDEGLAVLRADGEIEFTDIRNSLWPMTDDMPDWQREDLCDVLIDEESHVWLYDQATLSRLSPDLTRTLFEVTVQELEVGASSFEELSHFPIEPPGRRMALLRDGSVVLIEKFDGFLSVYDRQGTRLQEFDLEERYSEDYSPLAVTAKCNGEIVLLADPTRDSLLGIFEFGSLPADRI